MTRFSHGPEISVTQIATAITTFRGQSGSLALTSGMAPEAGQYGFLFKKLQENPDNLLPENSATAPDLILLGQAMVDPNPANPAFDSAIPSAYTYFGQFIDHDITRQSMATPVVLDENVMPLPPNQIPALVNSRTAGLDLDSVYGPAIEPGASYDVPRNGDRLVIERAIPDGAPDTDLARDPDAGKSHPAFIGDRRNDENLIVSQMHLAFLRAHNVLINRGASFEEARKILRRHYQWIIVHDYLNRIADPAIVTQVLEGQIDICDDGDDEFLMPLEFSVAGLRFGHSMIRDVYNYNDHFDKAFLYQILLPGPLVKYHHILDTWVIDWNRFVDGRNVARRIDTLLAEGLQLMDDGQGGSLKFGLAVLDLLRGYLLRLPTGQAVANALNLTPMSAAEIHGAIGEQQAQVLSAACFSNRTPLWFYILAEAAAATTGRLGPVGSTIAAAVLVRLVRGSKDSFLRNKNWVPSLGNGPHFDLSDLFRLAGVLPNGE